MSKMPHRRAAAALAIIAAVACGGTAPAAGETYPDRAVRMVIGFPAGGTIDALGRILAQKLTEAWGQNVLVENRAGASGSLGAQAAAQGAPDGYTLHLGAQTLAVNVTLAPVKGFDPRSDLAPIMLVATAQDVLMVPEKSPFRSVRELIDYAKAHPNELDYASLGPGSSGHLATALFSQAAGIKLQHVPYSQYNQAVTDFLSGRTALWMTTLGGAIGNIQAGKMRALAVSGRMRAPALPDVPTFQEAGVDLTDESSWYALFAPKGTPAEIIAKVNADAARVIAAPDVRAREASMGFRFVGGTPQELAAFLAREIAKWAEVVKSASLAPP
jgi:tripartite-type tricarboxylate transporter receptor subunit TctC